MSVRTGSTTVFQIPDQGVTAAGCSSGWCDLWAVATDPGVLTAVAIVGLAALVAFAYVRDAEAACHRERRRVLDERDAFESFADRVADIDTISAATDSTPSGVPAGSLRGMGAPGDGARGPGGGSPGSSVSLRRVMAAYDDTVLSLPHYRAEYDETPAESLAAELGPDAVTALASDGGLSGAAQSALVDRSRRAVDARERLADAIDEEIDAIGDRESALSAIDRRRRRLLGHLDGVRPGCEAEAAVDVWSRLAELEGECDDLAADRQRSLDDPPLTPRTPLDADRERPFYAYLYGPTDGPRYPVLAQIAEVADRIRADKDRVGGRIARGR
ncbi:MULTISPECIES: DUF7260 family protein [Halorubrum]|uniref:DUF7260 family protein n=1 Tax=Halorubrum TaxID=56688 RepID=UPI0010F608DF|nr:MULTISPECIES: hypothetical protein [Halorubrum]MDB2224844.1 hypothetical protein [Halorubrum ezzemoulense]MDB2237280.1 hypothetical protein [Halorubrum ezzemoulense]MDB2246770.1 hypothetical protein [Halorubrum ezzemoulense]MDB2273113.1 hypothetical protein [Halorubrum ezzemoulense]TKX43828.1 hypothetical protein EXE41_14810 [Halorubrum sp. SD690R]